MLNALQPYAVPAPPPPLAPPPPPPPPPPAPAAPAGGTPTTYPTFLYGAQPAAAPTGGATVSLGAARAVTQTYQNPTGLRQELVGILQEGVNADLAGAQQARLLDRVLSTMQPGQLESLKNLVNAGTTRAEQVFILKAFAANENWTNLTQFAAEMRGRSEAEIVARCTMRDDRDVIQQWQDACGPTMLQAAAGEVDPRFAWELNKSTDLATVDPLGSNNWLAQQQKQWLEAYGGRAVQRGQSGGTGIAIGQMLNDMLAPITGARYQTAEVTNKAAALNDLATRLASGLDVPLRVSWDRPGQGDSGHFVLAMGVRQGSYGREFQINDPWNGKTAWVPESALMGDTLPPMFPQYARLTHTYVPTAMV